MRLNDNIMKAKPTYTKPLQLMWLLAVLSISGSQELFAQSPGGVSLGFKAWYKADAGVTSSGGNVSQWQDTKGGYHAVQNTAFYQPTLGTADLASNFNPYIFYSGGAKFLAYKGTRFMTAISSASIFGAGSNKIDNRGYENFADFGIDNPHMGLLNNTMMMWMNGSVAPGPQVNHTTKLTKDINQVYGWNWTGGTNGGGQLRLEGDAEDFANMDFNYVGMGGPSDGMFTIGSYEGVENWNGRIYEVIVYDQNLLPVQKQKIDTYLAIKYGTTIESDYIIGLDLSPTKIWNRTADATYSNNIFGIGRDNTQGLHQKQSNSTRGGFQPIVSTSGFAASNTANAMGLTDGQFFMSGSDTGDDSFSSTFVVGNTLNSRITRVWKTNITGGVGSVTVAIPKALVGNTVTNMTVIKSSDASITTSDNQTAMTLTTIGGVQYYTASVTFASGDYYTFAAYVVAPGCVTSGLNVWFRANDLTGNDGDKVSTWTDAYSNKFTIAQATVSRQPTFYKTTADKLVNFNPSVFFVRSSAQDLVNTTVALNPAASPKYHYIAAAKDMDNTLNFQPYGSAGLRAILGNGIGGNNPAMDIQKDGASWNGWNPWTDGFGEWGYGGGGKATMYNGGGVGKTGSTYFLPATDIDELTNQQPQVFALGYGSGTRLNSWVDGYKEATPLGIIESSTKYAYFSLGTSGGGEWWDGTINEMVHYNRELTDAEMQRVNSYMAIKYGVTLGQGNGNVGLNNGYNYLSGDGTIIWNTSTNTGYNSNIYGIARDNCQGLDQKQSMSVNNGFQPIFATTGFAATNPTNATSLSEKTFELAGSDLGKAAFETAFVFGNMNTRMTRIWKVQETGTVANIKVAVLKASMPGINPTLIRSTDATINGSDTFVPLATTETLGGVEYLTATVDLNDGEFFTFGVYITAPGCVTANLRAWYKADFGVTGTTKASKWKDIIGGYDVSQSNATYQPTIGTPSAVSNFNALLSFGGTSYMPYKGPRFMPTTSSGSVFGAGNNKIDHLGYENFAVLGIDNPHMGLLGETYMMWMNGSAAPGPQVNHGTKMTKDVNQIYGWNWTGGTNGGGQLRLDGTPEDFANMDFNYVGSGGVTDGMFTIGGWEAVEKWNGNVYEVVIYDRNLSAAEKQRVDSYLAIKYGTTLKNNYLSGAATTVYDVTTYPNNIAGIARQDCQGLHQKQSKSVNPNSLITVGIDYTITASNSGNSGAFNNDDAFLLWGDNAGTGLVNTTASPCNPPIVDKATSLQYKFTETGTVEGVKLSADLSSFGFNQNYPVYMQVSADAAFTSFSNIPMSRNGANYEAQYDFASGTSYVRFAGNTSAPANICTGNKIFNWQTIGTYWNWGTRSKDYTVGSGADAQVIRVNVSDVGNVMYIPQWYPVSLANHLYIPRYDNSPNSKIVTTIKLLDAAGTLARPASALSFRMTDIDGFIGGRDVVNIYGKLAGVQVNPKLSRNRWTDITITPPNQGMGGVPPWDWSWWGQMYVDFEAPVDEIVIEYTKNNTYAFKVFNDIAIGPLNITCKPKAPEVANNDNVYLFKEVSENPGKANDPFTYKFTFQNLGCANKTVNFADQLPAGLAWVDSTLASSLSMGAAAINAPTRTLTIASIVVPPGTSYLYMDAVGATPATYNNQATFTVGANSYQSDEPTLAGASNPTPITLSPSSRANIAVGKTVNKSLTAQGTEITYTFSLTNNEGSNILTYFNDALDEEATYVAGSLTGVPVAASVNTYGGQGVLDIRNLTLNSGATLTFSVKANVNGTPNGNKVDNIAQLRVDPSVTNYSQASYKSPVATTEVGSPLSANNPPAQSANTSSVVSKNAQTELTPTGGKGAYTYSNDTGNPSCVAPAGATMLPSASNLTVTASTGAYTYTTPTTPGTYYYCIKICDSGTPQSCVTRTYTVEVKANPLMLQPAPDRTVLTGQTVAGTAGAELAPTGGTGAYTYSNDTGNATCTPVPNATALAGVSVNPTTGIYNYTAPSTAGTYYFCVKVCDSGGQCLTRTYKITVNPAPCPGDMSGVTK